jgi:hypothetical protein
MRHHVAVDVRVGDEVVEDRVGRRHGERDGLRLHQPEQLGFTATPIDAALGRAHRKHGSPDGPYVPVGVRRRSTRSTRLVPGTST